MAHAICSECGKEVPWRARRGVRLADLRSLCCNAPMKGLTAGRRSAVKGQTYERCAICGRPRLPQNLVKVPVGFVEMFSAKHRRFEAGTAVCWTHSILPDINPTAFRVPCAGDLAAALPPYIASQDAAMPPAGES